MKKMMVLIIIMAVILMATLAQAGEVRVMVVHYLFQEGENATLENSKDWYEGKFIKQGTLKDFVAKGWTIVYVEKMDKEHDLLILEKK